jgi:hypothetical protein
MRYENPQYLVVSGSSLPNGSVLPPLEIEAYDKGFRSDGPAASSSEVPEDVDIHGILNSFPQNEYGQAIDLDPVITTKLLP